MTDWNNMVLLQPDEWAVAKTLAEQKGMTVEGVMRQALRLYQMHDKRLSDGETCTYSGDAERARRFAGDLVKKAEVRAPARNVPISAAKRIAEDYGYDQIVIIARRVGEEDGLEAVTTYGRNREHCDVAAKMGKFLKHRVMGWPEDFEGDRRDSKT